MEIEFYGMIGFRKWELGFCNILWDSCGNVI